MISAVFFGSSSYSVIVLSQLIKLADYSVKAVVTKIDKPTGRQQTITANPVAQFAQQHHLPLIQTDTFDNKFHQQFKSLQPDLVLVVAFGPPFFTPQLINIPQYGIVNIHPSPLPKYRGATPGPWQIINGETQSAVTFFLIDPLPDHGPIITQIPFGITSTDTADTFYGKAFTLAAANLEPVLKSYIKNPKSLTSQDHSQKSYFPKLSKDSAQINWSWPEAKIERFIRALNPWPIAWTWVKNQQSQQLKMKIFSSTFRLSDFPTFRLNTVQIEGKNKVNWSEIKPYYSIIKS